MRHSAEIFLINGWIRPQTPSVYFMLNNNGHSRSAEEFHLVIPKTDEEYLSWNLLNIIANFSIG